LATRLLGVRATLKAVEPAPLASRCCRKQLGYAGDFELMNMIYRSESLGETLFGRALNQAGLGTLDPSHREAFFQNRRQLMSAGAFTGRHQLAARGRASGALECEHLAADACCQARCEEDHRAGCVADRERASERVRGWGGICAEAQVTGP
jgi:hypothetical protein